MTTPTPVIEERERVARPLAESFTGFDPDTIVTPDWRPMPQMRGGFSVAPEAGQCSPLWHFFLQAADAVIDLLETTRR